MLNTVPNTAAQTTTPQMALPDASDNASSLVGYNINNYVFGDLNGTDTYTPNSQNQTVQNNQMNPNATNPITNKKTNPILGILGLGALVGAGYIGIKKAKGQKITLPKFETIKATITDFLNKFKKEAPKKA